MRQLYYLLLLVFIPFSTTAQTFDTEAIVQNGENDKRINFVYLGDGYTGSELSAFISDVNSAIAAQFSYSPYKEYRNFFNAYAIKVISNESGVNHPQTVGTSECNAVPITLVDNYFGSEFDFGNIHRLLVPKNSSKISSVLIDNTPFFDQANVIVNTPYYGGSGGIFATASTNTSSNQVMVHEIGHSFVDLGDEYWAGPQYASEKLNRTQQSGPSLIKWKNWIGDEGVGVYPYGNSSPLSDWFKPHQTCIMQFLNFPFCAVCREGTIDKIYNLVTPIDSFLPLENSVTFTGSDIDFSLNLILPDPNTLKIEWILDGNTISTDTNTITLTSSEITNDNHVLTANIDDTTLLARSYVFANGYHFNITWNITKDVLDVEENTISKFLYKAYPNPVNDVLYFEYTIQNIQDNITLQVSDIQGKEIIAKSFLPKNSKDAIPIDVKILTSGIYFLNVRTTNYNKTFKFIKQ